MARTHGVLLLLVVGCSTSAAPNEPDANPPDELCGALTHCIVYDDGWNFRCEDGRVFVDDLTRNGYCQGEQTEPACETGGVGDETLAATCTGACLDADVRWVETIDEFEAFVPTSLCASGPT